MSEPQPAAPHETLELYNSAPETRSTHESRIGRGALFGLFVLFSMNLLNYVDRYVFNVLGEQISEDLSFSYSDLGILNSSFMVLYTLVSLAMGYLGDRFHRPRLLASGVGLWSLATVGTAFAGKAFGWNFAEMFFWRAVLGVGEATYGIIAPTLLADLFRPSLRSRVIGVFYLALPFGGAIGYKLGGWIGHHWGWRQAFLVVGIPGLIASFAALLIRDPGRGASEGQKAEVNAAPGWADYLILLKNRSFLFNTAGLTAITFATGAYAAFNSIFYQRIHNLNPEQVGDWLGPLAVTAGLVGITLGIVVPDQLRKYTGRAYLLWASLAATLAAPAAGAAFIVDNLYFSFAMVFVASTLMASVLGPCNTVTADVVPASRRAAGFAMSIFLLHALGDILSPPLIGWVSQVFGQEPMASSWFGRTLSEIGHPPFLAPDKGYTNLTTGLLLVVPMLALGGLFFLLGSGSLASDREKARLASEGSDASELLPH